MMFSHRNPEAMARCLVTYIPCDRKVRSEIMAEFVLAPMLSTISGYRRQHEREKAMIERGKIAAGCEARGWDWRGINYSTDMEIASGRLLDAIERERRML